VVTNSAYLLEWASGIIVLQNVIGLAENKAINLEAKLIVQSEIDLKLIKDHLVIFVVLRDMLSYAILFLMRIMGVTLKII